MVSMRALYVFVLGLALRLALIARFPLIFGGDPVVRLLHRDRIFIGHDLPLLQLLIFGLEHLTHRYIVILCAMAIIGAAAGVAFYLLALDLMDEPAAFWAALFLSTNPWIAAYSIMPFQEALMLGTLLMAFHTFYTGRPGAASIWLALDCFTRFEAWAAAPALAAAYIWKRGVKPAVVFRGLALFGWAPAVWIVFRHGLAPEGSYVIESHLTIERLMRWVYTGYITAKFTPVIVIAAGLLGFWWIWKEGWAARLWPLILFFALYTIALLFSAHGIPPNPDQRVTGREAHVWIAALVLASGFALAKFKRYRAVVGVAGVLFGIWGSYRFVQHEDADPHLTLSYRLAKFFDNALQPGERALILSPPWSRAPFDSYLQQARKTGGAAGYRAAVRNLAENADMTPPSYQLTLIHSRFDRERLLWETGPCAQWIAVWSDYASPPQDLPLPETVLHSGDLSVRVSRFTCP